MNFLLLFLSIYMLVVGIALLSHVFMGQYLNVFEHNVLEDVQFWKKIWSEAKNNNCVIKSKYINKLKKPYYLVGFYRFLKELNDEERIELLVKNEDGIIKRVSKLRYEMKTYFAFIIGDFSYPEGFLDYHYDELLIDFTQDKSVHLRENSLKALYHIGHPDMICDAFVQLSKLNITHSEKLLSDGLLECNGNPQSVASDLFDGFGRYIDCYKQAVINYLFRNNVHTYDEELKKQLLTLDLSTDIKCSILRLVGRQATNENGEFIAEYIENNSEDSNWETITVAVGVLGNFERTENIVSVLTKALTSSAWYIRMNAAKSICKIGITPDEIESIRNGNDSYAVDALNYAMNRM